MNKTTALWVMLGGVALSGYDLMTTKAGAAGGELYAEGKPLASLRWNFYKQPATTSPAAPAKNYYISISDAAALVGAYFYFR